MKRNSFVCLLIALSTASAWAAEDNAGTIHFTGEIITPSCVIDGEGGGTDYTVNLGSYPASHFTESGVEGDPANFSISLKDCPLSSEGLENVQLTFTGATALTKSVELLDVSYISTETAGTTAATGIGIKVTADSDDTVIKFDGSDGLVYVPLPTTITTTSIPVNFTARYVSFADTVTAGPADADLTINILYR
ncbi:fimbrial protein [Buttiauxella agrestis]